MDLLTCFLRNYSKKLENWISVKKRLDVVNRIVLVVFIGLISVGDWCKAMETATGLELPWRMLRNKLVEVDTESQMVIYRTTIENIGKTNTNVSLYL